MTTLTAERLRELLQYDPSSGLFTYRVQRGKQRAGNIATTIDRHGYITISIDYRRHFAHRLAFLFMHDEWPKGDIDHINGIKGDNRFHNLRVVNNRTNLENQRKAPRHNLSTGILGVSRSGGSKKNPYRASIMINGRFVHLGNFPTSDAARTAYLHAKRQHHGGCTI